MGSSTMKLIISVLLLLVLRAAAQSSNATARGLERLEEGRNTLVVGDCNRTTTVFLTCSLLGNDLAINNTVYVTTIKFALQLCDSALLVNLTLSDGTVTNAANLAQCDTQRTLGQLMLTIYVAVFIDIQNNTVINTSAAFNVGGDDVPLFDETSIPLDQNCPGGVTPPPESCNPTTTMTPVSTTTMTPETTQPPTEPTTGSPPVTTSSPSASRIDGGVIAIIVVVSIVAVVVVVIACLAVWCYQRRRKEKFSFNGFQEKSPLASELTSNPNKEAINN